MDLKGTRNFVDPTVSGQISSLYLTRVLGPPKGTVAFWNGDPMISGKSRLVKISIWPDPMMSGVGNTPVARST